MDDSVPTYADHVEMLAAAKPDTVVISSPHGLHLPRLRFLTTRHLFQSTYIISWIYGIILPAEREQIHQYGYNPPSSDYL
ncbi:hypothetical protein F4X90_00125 [Candidatus Poribacteria bacterium]|nr:hypothetical protein [Candidatus Poribacteria bacterium]